ncbi:MAG: 5'/3'-nucleotidase SurE [Rhodospirillaceae bacterium]|nr:5'/3'-nucleotidase SurE [Rhodospirillaceae bacterium]|tara:strand:- start:3370 stop:4131 length:762 start_codon:yes stop_codon:yes gene_type:complete
MRILLANDDGFGAPGLKRLESIARTISSDIWVVAPDSDKSGASHSLSLDVPLRYRQLGDQMFSVAGTPTDCVLLALLELIPPPKPDLILAGVNAGTNLGDDVTYSGTVAAAIEGSLHRIPAIALSQHIVKPAPGIWQPVEQYGAMVIKRLLSAGWPLHVVINVNFPSISQNGVRGITFCRQGKGKPGSKITRRLDPKGREYCWIDSVRSCEELSEDSDRFAIENGFISLTPLRLNLTDEQILADLSQEVDSVI